MGKSAAAAVVDPIGTIVRKGVSKAAGGAVGDAADPLGAAIDPSASGSGLGGKFFADVAAQAFKPQADLGPQDVATRESDVTTRRAATSIGSNEQYLLDPSGDALNQPKRKGAASRSLGSTF